MHKHARKVLGFLLGAALGIALGLLTDDVAKGWETRNRCDYHFPWSGQCNGVNGHAGEHY